MLLILNVVCFVVYLVICLKVITGWHFKFLVIGRFVEMLINAPCGLLLYLVVGFCCQSLLLFFSLLHLIFESSRLWNPA